MLFTINLKELKITRPHFPVMLNEVLHYVLHNLDCDNPNLIFLDCTFGAGGYTEAILKHTKAKVISFDRDENTVIQYVEKIKKVYKDRFIFIPDKFSTYKSYLEKLNIFQVDGIIMDLGFSNMQISSRDRGFSFKDTSSLSMTMGKNETTGFDIVNSASSELLADIIYHYGDEKKARQITNKILKIRETKKIETASELANIVRGVVGYKRNKKSKSNIDPSTKTFQALRIYVNDELNELQTALNNSKECLKKNGNIVVVSFHSLEDRIVKQFFSQHGLVIKEKFTKNKENPTNIDTMFNILSKKPILPSQEEIDINPESRSAKLRVASRL